MSRRPHIGILGGSFNPVHIGHLILADYLVQFTDLDEVWLMLSPANPLKAHPEELVDDNLRMEMLHIATDNNPRLKPCGIELDMPRPSYTIDSLSRLSSLYPECRFSLIIGSDNWLIFDRWRQYRDIMRDYSPMVYPRPGYETAPESMPGEITYVDAPVIDISSSFIRKAIAQGKDMTYFLPAGIPEYIRRHNLYISHL